MERVLVLGGGFAGIAALRALRGVARAAHRACAVTLIDKSRECSFLPLLPDVIGRPLPAEALTFDLSRLASSCGAEFVCEEVVAVDTAQRQVYTSVGQYAYDYALIAAGSLTNFYGNAQIRQHAYKLDDASDARLLRTLLEKKNARVYCIAGAGYTGIEIATHLRRYFGRGEKAPRIVIIERAPQMLGPVPEWMRAYVRRTLAAMDIEVMTNAAIERVEADMVQVAGQGVLRDAVLVWAAGVCTPAFVQKLSGEKTPQGRIKVDPFLRIDERVFVAGDCTWVPQGNVPLRMGVQFAHAQGICAAGNILRMMRSRPLRPYVPHDLGYIVPLANNRGCGYILGIPVIGPLASAAHYAMCVYRSIGIRNRLRTIRGVVAASAR
jgi:NADH dehydrogenase